MQSFYVPKRFVVRCSWGFAPDPDVFRFQANGTYRIGNTLFREVACAVWLPPDARVAPQQSPIPQEAN